MLKKVKKCSSAEQVMSQLRNITCHMGSYSVTCHPPQVNTPRLPALTSARQADIRFSYSGGMEG